MNKRRRFKAKRRRTARRLLKHGYVASFVIFGDDGSIKSVIRGARVKRAAYPLLILGIDWGAADSTTFTG
jgi:hypothetical protein